MRAVVADLAASGHAMGELMLEVAPACLSDIEAADVLVLLCEEIGEPLDRGLAARRYAISGDRRALRGTVLQALRERLPGGWHSGGAASGYEATPGTFPAGGRFGGAGVRDRR
ncbi:hypothetical protein [Streptomyces sp. NRRL S-31]|uniref:hypothetical protein n=1 Tax=Streptomyces sp. NRRL S-31 TaxID=1463898 RepID=UPI0004C93B13|nr:hypothetical protein [Streptomyces sp. NRRL S-31]